MNTLLFMQVDHAQSEEVPLGNDELVLSIFVQLILKWYQETTYVLRSVEIDKIHSDQTCMFLDYLILDYKLDKLDNLLLVMDFLCLR